jgi:arsenite methyltransferase
MSLRLRFLAGQFARPSGWIGRWLIAPWLDRISRSMAKLALERLELQPDERVLEVGFGGGGLLRLMLERHPAVLIGVDASAEMVARARRSFAAETGSDRLLLYEASVDRLPLPAGSVTSAVSLNSLYFWPDLPAAFAELARVVKPGGRLVLCFEPADELRKWPGHVHGFRLLEVRAVRAFMEGAGFGEISVRWGEGRKPARFCCLSGTRLGANG